MSSPTGAGPLAGLRVVELGGIGPVPFAGMLLADWGAEVIRVDRPGGLGEPASTAHAILLRGRRSVTLDLGDPQARAVLADLVASADIVVEGFRPGVAERLGIGPEAVLRRTPTLIYGRMSGWGQSGPSSGLAGHDINYLAGAGLLAALPGPGGRPAPPLNVLGDFGGGGMLLVAGLLAALWHRARSGAGQVVDAAIVDGVALQSAMHHSMVAGGLWGGAPGSNLFDGGAPFYRTYRCADGRFVAVGAIEPEFYRALVAGLGLSGAVGVADQFDTTRWADTADLFSRTFAGRAAADWLATFGEGDACVTLVVRPDEVLTEPHLTARQTYLPFPGGSQPAPAPRFQRTPVAPGRPAGEPGADTCAVLTELGVPDTTISALIGTPASTETEDAHSTPWASPPPPATTDRPADPTVVRHQRTREA